MTSEDRDFVVHPDMVGRIRRVRGAMIADNATVIGDVRLGPDVSIWFGVTVRGDDSWIEMGKATNIQDNAIVHVDLDSPQRIGTLLDTARREPEKPSRTSALRDLVEPAFLPGLLPGSGRPGFPE